MKTNKAGRKLAGLAPKNVPFTYDARFAIYGRIGASDDGGGFEWSGTGNVPAGHRPARRKLASNLPGQRPALRDHLTINDQRYTNKNQSLL